MYAIRQKSTGHYLPYYRRYRSPTHTEPSGTECPRTFSTLTAARNALNWWLEGKLTTRWMTNDDFGMGDDGLHLEPKPHRKKEDMEVVEVDLRVLRVL